MLLFTSLFSTPHSSSSSSRRFLSGLMVTSIFLLVISSCIHQSLAAVAAKERRSAESSNSENAEPNQNKIEGTSEQTLGTTKAQSTAQTQSEEKTDQANAEKAPDEVKQDAKVVNGSSPEKKGESSKNDTGASDEAKEKKGGNGEEGDGESENDFKKTIKKFSDMLSKNKTAAQNVMFGLIGLTSLVVLYFIIKTIRLRQKKSKNRKYGVLTNGMEMDHLESDSDDEDTTVFEINHHRR